MMPAQQARARSAIRRTSPGFNPRGSSPGSVIPFDHAATFELKGIPGNIIQDVINISSDGVFVAVAIGYGFEEDRARAIELGPPPNQDPAAPGQLTLSRIPPGTLIDGFRVNPGFEQVVFEPETPAQRATRFSAVRERTFSTKPITRDFESSLIQRIKPLEEISFLFSIVDTATGRELQDEPTHNLASLGKSNGERPFRPLAQALTFQPRSTVRLQIVERSEGVKGTLFIVLYGYKVLGSPGSAEPGGQVLRGLGSGRESSDRIVPFDYVASFQLRGQPGNQIEDEIPINAEGGFMATSIGYGLAVENSRVIFSGLTAPVSLRNLRLNQFPASALQDSVRVRPNFLRLAFENNGGLATSLTTAVANEVFERLNRPEDVSFRYSILDSGSGRELQNQPIHNIAGLGIADGDRPFKKLPKPMLFLPRSTIRLAIEELFGRGTLFIVFQGYKILVGASMSGLPTRGRSVRRR